MPWCFVNAWYSDGSSPLKKAWPHGRRPNRTHQGSARSMTASSCKDRQEKAEEGTRMHGDGLCGLPLCSNLPVPLRQAAAQSSCVSPVFCGFWHRWFARQRTFFRKKPREAVCLAFMLQQTATNQKKPLLGLCKVLLFAQADRLSADALKQKTLGETIMHPSGP